MVRVSIYIIDISYFSINAIEKPSAIAVELCEMWEI
jgi:hypothetical protein